MSHSRQLIVAILACLGSGAVVAQIVAPPPAAGYGAIYRSMDGFVATGNNNLNGATFLGGRYYVAGTVPGAHRIYVVSPAGTAGGSFLQPTAQLASVTGILNLTTDGTSLIGGSDRGISVFDTSGTLVPQVVTARGLRAVSNPILGAGLAAVGGSYRAVTFDPAGNGGSGSFWVGNGRNNVLQIDLGGNVLTLAQNLGLDITGFVGPEPCSGALWVSLANTGRIHEMTTAGLLTGESIPGPSGGGSPGGISAIWGGDPQTPWNNSLQIVSVYRSTPPRISIHRVHGVWRRPPPPPPWIVHGAREAFLEIGAGGGLSRGPVGIPPAASSVMVNINTNGEPGSVGPIWLLGFNMGPDTLFEPTTPYLGAALPEWVMAGPSSSRPIGMLATIVVATSTRPLSLPIPQTLALPPGSLIKLQALYFNSVRGDPVIGNTIATNSAYFVF